MKHLLHFPYQNVLVLGLAKSGTAAAHLLLDSGVSVVINDLQAEENDQNVADLRQKGAEFILGSHPISALEHMGLVVKNPGIPYDNEMVQEAMNKGIPVITEVELAGLIHEGSIVAITGSNGKTTTTTLIHEMLQASGALAEIAGNIGKVSCEVARSTTQDTTMIIEMSSFQLLGISSFRPRISVLLNVYEAHLDYHKTLENYQKAKAAIFSNQTKKDYLVYNADQPVVVDLVQEAEATLVPFSTTDRVDGGWLDEEYVYVKDEPVVSREGIALVGAHNLENIIAAVVTAKLEGASNKAIKHVLSSFSGVDHRLQLIKQKDDRMFYNDSKATNILATSKALTSFNQPIILLAGGLDRGNTFDELVPYLNNVKAMVLFGQTAEKLAEAGKKAGVPRILFADDVSKAVPVAYQHSREKDVILLSPACASWDQYRTFEQRGDMFVQAVHSL
ncbi:UDP-N-acetylmuramoyl-L-alanine--D-glutamate ligase [Thalassobacillus sp. CUG 92003]|uniref:UDP-N-acetylmuramoyl-L-alanine--D-glutamate ligase n=1 Tax=Thalassobacillus sp. CUG 92003 TaxID=2736641 RepID=UPI0015E65C51|nr:UDP-N-acetylmuramoyl-L-alanine--D-glutamate ligase [Thalassobacillus sp. CUG 92003]